MTFKRKQFVRLSAAVLSALVFATAAFADDTELFTGIPNAASTAQPNILFIIDDSGSMGTIVRTQPTYDPATVYSGACDPNRVYWRTDTGSPPACNTNRYFDKTALMCKAGLTALGTSGYFTDLMAQYNPSNGSKQWETISSSQKSRYVECQDDWGLHGGPSNPTTNTYPKNGVTNASNAWQMSSTGALKWGQSPANQVYTIYDGNYLNWMTGPTSNETRLQVVQEVATSLLNSINGVNVGLMTFNYDQGGYVVHQMEDIATSRASMISAINGMTASNWTPLSETLYEAEQYYAGRSVVYGGSSVAASRKTLTPTEYLAPLTDSCQKNFIVYLTDGEPTQDTDADSKIRNLKDANGDPFSSFVAGGTCDIESYPPGFSPSGGNCLDDLAEFLYKGDQSTLAGKQNIITYTIGFTVDLPILADTAARGGGAYYTANDTATLTTALSNIASSILDTQTTFVAPTVSVNTFNRTQNLNDLFISVFKASPTAHWPGNLKKYRLRTSDGAITDANGNLAVDPATGFFADTAQSYWSASVDGATVTQGGAANKLPDPASRRVYTYLGNPDLTNASNRVASANAGITDSLLNTGLPGDPTRDQVIDFINGVDVGDSNQNNSTTDARKQMGDPLHSQPTTVIYGPSLQDGLVFFATNDGYLHAVDTTSGIERWAFVPPDFLDNQVVLLKDETQPNKVYGIDGSLRIQMYADGNGIIEPAKGEKVYLFFGVRRGGDIYYGLDVTNPDQPRLLWRLDNSSLPGVGQTWATPVPAKMSISGAAQNAQKFVLVLGGGYEPDQDNVNLSTDTAGNSIYIIDSASGALLWQGTKTGGNKSFSQAGKSMDYSIPAEVKVVDFDGDGYADRMYAADMGGQVWRFDVWNGQPASSLITGGVIAQLGGAPAASPAISATRRFYYSPDVAMVDNKDYHFIHVGIGSGHRAHPLGIVNQDMFFALRDNWGQGKMSQITYDAITPIVPSDLTDITDDITKVVAQGQPGWRFELRDGGWRGEKVLAEARTFNNQVFFTTFRPSLSGTACEPQLGTNRLYVMSLFNGAPVNNLDNSASTDPLTASDRYKEFKGSISSEVVFIFPSPDQDLNHDGIPDTDANGDGIPDNCVGDQCSPPPIACVDLFCFPPNFANTPVRTFWNQEALD